jgi:hypothetical protein
MPEDVVFERIKAKENQYVLVVFAELVTPSLITSISANGSPRDYRTWTLR